MKGYKSFGKGLICQGKQYAENTVFEEDEVVVCQKGMHFCAEPMDVLDFYPPESEFAEVEALDEAKTVTPHEYVSGKLKIGAKISLKELINAQADIDFAKAKEEGSGNYAQGDWGHAVAQGNCGHAAVGGTDAIAAALGDCGCAAAQGNWVHAAALGDSGHAIVQGNSGRAVAQGNLGHAVAQGDNGRAVAQGNWGHAVAQSDNGHAVAQGNCGHAAAQGDGGHAAAQGDWGCAAVGGKDAIAAAFGVEGKAKARLGSWIMLAEWEHANDGWHIVTVKTAQIDGEKLKADTWYMLQDGEFVETED